MTNRPDRQNEDGPPAGDGTFAADEPGFLDAVDAAQAADNRGGSDLEQLKLDLADAENRALRYQADLDNFRRRTRREADETARYAALPLVAELLDALDNLNRALEVAQPGSDGGGALAEGVRMVAEQISRTLQNFGCQPIVSLGQPFDPNQHQAVQMTAGGQVPANHVAAELRPGFRLHDRVVRPAQVIVSTGP